MVDVDKNVELETSNGGSLTLVRPTEELRHFGVDSSGWATVDDLRFNPHDELSFDLQDKETRTTISHVGGKVVASFGLISRVPNGRCDVEVLGLVPNEWYRLEFGEILARSDAGFAHSKTSENGEVMFPGVVILDE
jgi:hypothetical protein